MSPLLVSPNHSGRYLGPHIMKSGTEENVSQLFYTRKQLKENISE